jgi:hypothetical protein
VLTAFLCLAVLAMLSVAQVTHTHAVSRDADHCAICVVLHSAIPVAAAATLVVLVHCVAVVPIFAAPPVSRIWHVQLFNRPPPASCPASFRFF